MKERGRGPLLFFVIVLMTGLLIIGVVNLFMGFGGVRLSPDLPQCSDTFDNDGDELVDLDDPDCYNNAGDDSEQVLQFNFYKSDGTLVAYFNELGDINLWANPDVYGACSGGVIPSPGQLPNCNFYNSYSDSFKLVHESSGAIVGLVDQDALLCASKANCEAPPSEICESSDPGAFLVKNGAGETVIYIDSDGDLCYTGQMNLPGYAVNLEVPGS